MNVIKEIEQINQRELDLGLRLEASWHWAYRNSSWIYAGGLPYELTEGDVLCVFSQYGEIEDIHLVRDDKTGKSKGFCFLKYEDFRSAVLAIDNFNGIEILGRKIRVDHKDRYSPPKKKDEENDESLGPEAFEPGHAYKDAELANEFDIHHGVSVFAQPGQGPPGPQRTRGGASGLPPAGAERGRGEWGKKDRKDKKHKKKKKRKEEKGRKRRRPSVSPSESPPRARRGVGDRYAGGAQPLPQSAPAPPPPPPAGGKSGAQSWRGRMDPNFSATGQRKGGPGPKRGRREEPSLSGVAGLGRRR